MSSVPNKAAMPRVLHVIEATLGGTLVYLDTIISATAGLPYQFGLAYSTLRATPALQLALDKAKACGWQLFQVEMTREIMPWQDLNSSLDLMKLFRRFHPDIIHCHSSKAGALGRIAAFSQPLRRPRVAYTPNSIAANLGKRYLMLERALAPLTTRMIPVTDSEAEELLTFKLTSDGKYQVVYPVVDCEYFAVSDREEARAALGLPREPSIFVAVGRLTAQKGPFAFLEIVKRVVAEFPEAQGVWVGDGELRDEFLRIVERDGLQRNVTLTGWQNDVRPWLAAADLLLSTSEYESFGYMVAEALAMERPVVATNIIGTCDIMRGELSPFLYTRGDTQRAAELIANLLRHPEVSLRCGQMGREMVAQRFSPAIMRHSLEAVYAQLS